MIPQLAAPSPSRPARPALGRRLPGDAGALTRSVTSLSLKIFKVVALSGVLSSCTTAGAWLSGGDPHHAISGLPDAAGWRGSVAAVAPGVPAPDPSSASPRQVAAFFAGLTDTQRRRLAAADPGVVGNLRGVPYSLRYAANAGTARQRTPGRLLGYDPRGDGRVIEVFGDLATARHIAVIVPGSGWDLGKIMHTDPRSSGQHNANPVVAAMALRAEMARLSPGTGTAVVVWLGYDAPEGIDRQAARSERAVAAAPALTAFLSDLPGAARITLIGHSYGTVVCGHALRGGGRADDVVALASPGMDAGSAGDLGTGARVWAARISDDLIGLTPHVRFGGYGHQTDPITPAFGARVFSTGAARGHGGYYSPGTESLANLARIALGRTADVSIAHPPATPLR
ncbi:alpha/beta hydrolase [Actinomadura scrupuli]|uniref:alpha/beta hydrolase n=1 Tax=Actinomadura scrupuli TaxID=559629 RepID=UPI003D950DEB